MRGSDMRTGELFSYVDLEKRVPEHHPLRLIRRIVNEVLADLDREFAELYAAEGRPSIAPERLLRALLLQAFYTIRSERQLMEQLHYNLLYRWFVGLGVDDPVWVPTVFTKNRNRLLRTQALHKRVDAVMLVATPLQAEDFADLVDLRLPGVTVSAGTPVPGWPAIRIDDVATARTATEHLIGLGHRRIAHITGDRDDELAFSTPHDRKAGYRAAHDSYGLAVDPELTLETGFTVRSGEIAAEILLRERCIHVRAKGWCLR